MAVLVSRRRFAALAATVALALTFSRANTSILCSASWRRSDSGR